jgi:hypothetical protein
MRIAEAGGCEKITWDGQQNFPQREVFFPQSPEASQTAKKSYAFSYDSVTLLPYTR